MLCGQIWSVWKVFLIVFECLGVLFLVVQSWLSHALKCMRFLLSLLLLKKLVVKRESVLLMVEFKGASNLASLRQKHVVFFGIRVMSVSGFSIISNSSLIPRFIFIIHCKGIHRSLLHFISSFGVSNSTLQLRLFVSFNFVIRGFESITLTATGEI